MTHQIIKNISKDCNGNTNNINFECSKCNKLFSTFELAQKCDHARDLLNKYGEVTFKVE